MKTSQHLLTALAATLCLGLAGCNKPADTTSTTGGNATPDASGGGSGKRKVLIGFIGKSLSNDVFQAAEAGARDAAKEAGAKYNVDVELEVRTPNDEDATKQAEAIEALSRRGAQGIAVSCSEANTVTPSIDQAVDKGAQVVCFDSDAPNSKRFAYYGTDDHECGLRVVNELAKVTGEKGNVAVLGATRARRISRRASPGSRKGWRSIRT